MLVSVFNREFDAVSYHCRLQVSEVSFTADLNVSNEIGQSALRTLTSDLQREFYDKNVRVYLVAAASQSNVFMALSALNQSNLLGPEKTAILPDGVWAEAMFREDNRNLYNLLNGSVGV